MTGASIRTLLLGALLGGCMLTPDEVQRVRVENELLREELRVVKQNCSYYRGLELKVEPDPDPER